MKLHTPYKISILTIFLIYSTLTLSACGNTYELPQRTHRPAEATLTVLAPEFYTVALERTEASMASAWAEEGRYFSLEATIYRWDEREQQEPRLRTMLMAGEAYDLIFWDTIPLWLHSGSGLLLDFYEVIDQDPFTEREDFFTHVLETWEVDGGLYIFPAAFRLEYVGINANLPTSIIEQFARYSSINEIDLFKIYTDLYLEYGTDLFIMNTFWETFPRNSIRPVLGNFIDFEARSSSLNDGRFAEYLDNVRQAIDLMGSPSPASEVRFSEAFINTRSRAIEQAEHFVFVHERNYLNPLMALIDPPEAFFVNFIPLADIYGRPRIEQHPFAEATWANLCISAGGDGLLAWEFVQHLLTVMLQTTVYDRITIGYGNTITPFFGDGSISIPIRREDFRPHMENVLNRAFREDGRARTFMGIPNSSAERVDIYEDAIARKQAFIEMPVAMMPFMPFELFEDHLDAFLLGSISSQEAANEIHNRIALWLIE